GEAVHLHQLYLGHRLHHELSDALAPREVDGLAAVVDQEHLELAAIAGVDEARCVEHGDALLHGEARARQHEPGVARRDGDGEPRRHETSLARLEARAFRCAQVEARVAWPGVDRQRESSVEPERLDVHAAYTTPRDTRCSGFWFRRKPVACGIPC